MSNHLLLDSPVSFEDVNSLDQSTYSALRELRNMRLSITGANGFLASNIVFYLHYLSCKFNLSIHIEALCRSEKKLFSRFTPDYLSSYGPNSLSYSYYSFNDIPHLEPSQVVIHAASNASPLRYSRDPVSTALINTQGTIAAIEYAKYSNSKCFVYFSTSGVYGFNNPSISSYKEDQFGFIDSANPENLYIESKRMGECITSSLCSQYNIPYIILRPSINYGPGLDLTDERSISNFLNSALLNSPIILTSDGLASRSYLYIRDFMELFIRAIASPCNGVLNIASSNCTQIIELARLIHSVSNILSPISFVQSSHANIKRVEFSNTSTRQDKAYSIYQWLEKVPLEVGVKRTLDHYKSL